MALITAAVCGCSPRPEAEQEPRERELFAMDTYMRLSAYGDPAQDALSAAASEIERLDGLWSVTSGSGEIYALNRDSRVEASPETIEIIETAAAVSDLTGGALDVTVYPAVRAWGFTTDAPRVPDDGELRAITPLVDHRAVKINGAEITLSPGMAVDLGALAKGYASQRAVDILRERGVTSGIVSLGGNVQTLGKKPDGSEWNVAIQDPEDPARYAGT
ncbi:MAG: FAD:protein FMN transferase, partial [Oscillospiraceae bacterium]|nr:FAD:protein FMN transferase [Oscillospiraceae bacterium]